MIVCQAWGVCQQGGTRGGAAVDNRLLSLLPEGQRIRAQCCNLINIQHWDSSGVVYNTGTVVE